MYSNLKICRKKLHAYNASIKQCPECRKESDLRWQQSPKRKAYKAATGSMYASAWRRANLSKYAAYHAKRRASKLQATPKWLSSEQIAEMQQIYIEARELSWLSPGGLEVDHIVPLNGKNVGGLHVPWNLQILPANLNRSKGNRHG